MYEIILPVAKLKLGHSQVVVGDVVLHHTVKPITNIANENISDHLYEVYANPLLWAQKYYPYLGYSCVAYISNISANADDIAIHLAAQKLEFVINQLVFLGFEGAWYGFDPAIVLHDKTCSVKFKFYGDSWKDYLYPQTKEIVSFNELNENLQQTLHISAFITDNQDNDRVIIRIKRAFDWYRMAKESNEQLYSFLFLWIGMEQLVYPTLKITGGSDGFDVRLFKRLQSIKIKVSQDLLSQLYSVRRKVFHEGEDPSEKDLNFAYSYLMLLGKIFSEIIMFALRFVNAELTLKDLWELKSKGYRQNDDYVEIS